MKIQQPTIGRIVFLTEHHPELGPGMYRPAVITMAVEGKHRVDLVDFRSGESIGNVPHEAGADPKVSGERFSWSWPTREILPDIEVAPYNIVQP